MNIFIYSHNPCPTVVFKKIVVALSQRGNVIVNQDMIKNLINTPILTDTQRYEQTMHALKKAQLCIFESSAPQFFDGFFLSLALLRNITSVVCSNNSSTFATVSGCTNPLCYYRQYKDITDLINQLAVFGV